MFGPWNPLTGQGWFIPLPKSPHRDEVIVIRSKGLGVTTTLIQVVSFGFRFGGGSAKRPLFWSSA